MNRTVRIPRGGTKLVNEPTPSFDMVIEPGEHRNRFKLLPWLAAVICIFALIYGSGYFALLWLPPHPEVDMRSQLVADYSPWPFLIFQPVDPAIIEEIRQEQKLPEEIVVDGSFWPTSSVVTQRTNSNPTAIQVLTSTPQPTVDHLLSNPTASLPPNTPSPQPTSVTLSTEPTNTLTSVAPSKPTRRPKPIKPPKPEKSPKPDKNNR